MKKKKIVQKQRKKVIKNIGNIDDFGCYTKDEREVRQRMAAMRSETEARRTTGYWGP